MWWCGSIPGTPVIPSMTKILLRLWSFSALTMKCVDFETIYHYIATMMKINPFRDKALALLKC